MFEVNQAQVQAQAQAQKRPKIFNARTQVEPCSKHQHTRCSGYIWVIVCHGMSSFHPKFNIGLYLVCKELQWVLPWPFLLGAPSEWTYPISQVKPPFCRVLGTNSILSIILSGQENMMIWYMSTLCLVLIDLMLRRNFCSISSSHSWKISKEISTCINGYLEFNAGSTPAID